MRTTTIELNEEQVDCLGLFFSVGTAMAKDDLISATMFLNKARKLIDTPLELGVTAKLVMARQETRSG